MAADQTKKSSQAERLLQQAPAAKQGKGGPSVGDPTSTKLEKVAKNVGNQAMDDRIKGANGQRDALLKFITSRLGVVQGVQLRELAEMKDERDWFREVAKGKSGFSNPEPTRWHDCARLYKRAAESLAAGNLGQGANLVEKALAAERAAFRDLPVQITENLQAKEGPVANNAAPSELGEVSGAAACARTTLPREVRMANEILNIQDHMEHADPMEHRRKKAWFESEEEEDKEAEGEAGGVKDKQGKKKKPGAAT